MASSILRPAGSKLIMTQSSIKKLSVDLSVFRRLSAVIYYKFEPNNFRTYGAGYMWQLSVIWDISYL